MSNGEVAAWQEEMGVAVPLAGQLEDVHSVLPLPDEARCTAPDPAFATEVVDHQGVPNFLELPQTAACAGDGILSPEVLSEVSGGPKEVPASSAPVDDGGVQQSKSIQEYLSSQKDPAVAAVAAFVLGCSDVQPAVDEQEVARCMVRGSTRAARVALSQIFTSKGLASQAASSRVAALQAVLVENANGYGAAQLRVIESVRAFKGMVDNHRPEWSDEGLCKGLRAELFYPVRGESSDEAKEVCMVCPVAPECLGFAVRNGERFGVWGGTSERERRRLRRGLQAYREKRGSQALQAAVDKLGPNRREVAMDSFKAELGLVNPALESQTM